MAGDQVYAVAPLAVSTVELPIQRVGEAGLIDRTGNGLITNVAVFEFVQPLRSVPLTL